MIGERRRHGSAIVLTTHHMDEAEILGDNIIVLSKGHKQVEGTPMELKQQLGTCHPYTWWWTFID